MTRIEKNRPAQTEAATWIEVAECNQSVSNTEQIEEKETMFELDQTVSVEFDDRTYQTEAELRRFLTTLTDAQLAATEVIVDDDSFVVFYPLLPKVGSSGYHFDTDYPRPTVASAEVPELVGVIANQSRPVTLAERQAGLAILLASVRL